MAGAALLGAQLSARMGVSPMRIAKSESPLALGWAPELEAARPALSELAQAIERVLRAGRSPLTTMGRCACALATLPVVARNFPDARIVWLDAHADSNTPATTVTGYLGGLVLTGAAGLWHTGLGGGLSLSNVVLVGARDIDPAERVLIEAGAPQLVAPGANLAARLQAAVGDSPVYVHIDCDVLDPGIVPTEYTVAGGLSLADLRSACATLARNEVIGVEVAELEATGKVSEDIACATKLLDALQPLLDALSRSHGNARTRGIRVP
ncbi:MAG: arginase/agmatinase/formiminoglutamase [Gammaproteobacteria bacterium]|nr:arginase/agmatinase/formiminoglutamase [Gammaproteobacteria bacterium]